MSGDTWPEQEVVSKWLQRRQIFCKPEEAMELIEAVTKSRLEVQEARDTFERGVADRRVLLGKIFSYLEELRGDLARAQGFIEGMRDRMGPWIDRLNNEGLLGPAISLDAGQEAARRTEEIEELKREVIKWKNIAQPFLEAAADTGAGT